MITVRTVDLFAGCGGITQGFHQATNALPDVRFNVLAAVEMDLNAAATYAANFGHDVVRNIRIEDWLDLPGTDHGDEPAAHVVVGGPPCQGFSNLGRRSPTDPRNRLWREYVRVLTHIQPYYFVMENVPAFFKSQEWTLFRSALATDGALGNYDFMPGVLNAADFGVPQARKRAVVIGWRRDRDPVQLPVGTYGQPRTVRDAIGDLEPQVLDMDLPEGRFDFGGTSVPGAFKTSQLHLTRKLTPLSLARFQDIPEGGNRKNIHPSRLAPCWVNHDTGSLDVMGRLRWDRPSVTIRTEFMKPEKGRYLHPEEHRPITHAEAALVQTFPLDFQWCGSKVQIAKQIGNAVPVKLAEALGTAIAEQFVT